MGSEFLPTDSHGQRFYDKMYNQCLFLFATIRIGSTWVEKVAPKMKLPILGTNNKGPHIVGISTSTA